MSATSYATPADMIVRYDVRDLGMLVRDNGTTADPTELLTDPVLQTCLNGGAGELESALLHGARYQVADLAGLTGNSLAYLVDLNCILAFWRLWKRRTWQADDARRWTAKEEAEQEIERLRRGEHVFNVPQNIAAGLPSVTGPSRVDLQNLNLIRDQASRFYPIRVLPNNR